MSGRPPILINDLSAHTAALREDIDAAVRRVLHRGWYVLGPEVEEFERAFADYLGVAECKTVASGTDALELALRSVGVGAGDRVATVANAGMYTTIALQRAGTTPEFMDVAPETGLVTSSEVERMLASGVKAVVVTHLYGRAVANIGAMAAACRQARVALIEDCAQAHGAKCGQQRVGSFGDAGCFSFYPTKNLGALGDGGAIVTKDKGLADRITQLRQYGWSAKYTVALEGGRNSRLDELQAAILAGCLPKLDTWNQRRRQVAQGYRARISHPEVILPPAGEEDYVAHLFVVRSSRRDALRAHLAGLGVMTDVHYPVPDHRQPVFADRFACINLENTERLAREVLTLPCFPEMASADQDRVIEAVNSWRP